MPFLFMFINFQKYNKLCFCDSYYDAEVKHLARHLLVYQMKLRRFMRPLEVHDDGLDRNNEFINYYKNI